MAQLQILCPRWDMKSVVGTHPSLAGNHGSGAPEHYDACRRAQRVQGWGGEAGLGQAWPLGEANLSRPGRVGPRVRGWSPDGFDLSCGGLLLVIGTGLCRFCQEVLMGAHGVESPSTEPLAGRERRITASCQPRHSPVPSSRTLCLRFLQRFDLAPTLFLQQSSAGFNPVPEHFAQLGRHNDAEQARRQSYIAEASRAGPTAFDRNGGVPPALAHARASTKLCTDSIVVLVCVGTDQVFENNRSANAVGIHQLWVKPPEFCG